MHYSCQLHIAMYAMVDGVQMMRTQSLSKNSEKNFGPIARKSFFLVLCLVVLILYCLVPRLMVLPRILPHRTHANKSAMLFLTLKSAALSVRLRQVLVPVTCRSLSMAHCGDIHTLYILGLLLYLYRSGYVSIPGSLLI